MSLPLKRNLLGLTVLRNNKNEYTDISLTDSCTTAPKKLIYYNKKFNLNHYLQTLVHHSLKIF